MAPTDPVRVTLFTDEAMAQLAAYLGITPADMALVLANQNTLLGYTGVLDDGSALGLLGAENSVAYRVQEIERHFHVRERWCGTGGNFNTLAPHQIDSGNNTWGNWVQILPIGSTPVISGMVHWDAHRINIVASQRTTPYKIQLLWKTATQTEAQALAAGQYTEIYFAASTATFRANTTDVKMPRLDAGLYSLHARYWNAAASGTVDFFLGVHEYEG